jgi:IS605 OrfB family transposase
VGANNLVACTTTTGSQYLYDGRDLFEQFHETTEQIAYYQSLLGDQRKSSRRIDRLYRNRTNRHDHAQDSLVRDLVERLYDEGVSKLYVGDIEDVLSTHWLPVVNEKTHNFWAYRQFINRLEDVCEEYGIEVREESEAWTSQECPECGEREETIRHEGSLTCPCGFEGHADLVASESFLRQQDDALTACNGETWNSGFDLPFLRSACHRNGVAWPFNDIAYADTMEAVQRFDTGEASDLISVYDQLIGEDSCDPFGTAPRRSPRSTRENGSHCSSITSRISSGRGR